MKIVLLGDIHGRWNKVKCILDYELGEEGYAISTGDLINYDRKSIGKRKLLFCYGNHDNPQYIQELHDAQDKGLMPLFPGQVYRLPDGTTIASLPGVYSDHWYKNGGKLKYFSQEDLQKLLRIQIPIDILMTHEAPLGVGLEKAGRDLGKTQVNQVIESLKPRICFFGHHHLSLDTIYKNCRVVGLNMPHRSYVVLDTKNFSFKKINASLEGKIGYKYHWEKGKV